MRRRLVASIVALCACTSGGRSTTTGGPTTTGGTSGGPCQGLACFRVSCPAGAATTVSGKVTAPNGRDPVPEALIYVPTVVPEFSKEVQCEVCNDPTGGAPIASAISAVDGSFRLLDVPATTNVPIVIQKGRFRRRFELNVGGCIDTPLTLEQTRLPKNHQEGDLPKMAVAVGDYDQIECVLRSFGIDDGEFTRGGGAGAVHLYDNGSVDGASPGLTPFEAVLRDPTRLKQYNLVFINCTDWGPAVMRDPATVRANLRDYVQSGGRLYATDWAYDYIEQIDEFAPYIFFDGGGSMTAPQPLMSARLGYEIVPFSATVTDAKLVEWLQVANATTGNTIEIDDLLPQWVLVSSTAGMDPYPTQTWIRGLTNRAERPLSVTFDYNMCGRVLFSSYHTRHPGGRDTTAARRGFPSYCKSSSTSMTAQEKVLEYLILHISSCVGPVG